MKEICHFKTIDYVICFPDDYSPDKKYPLLIYLHGAGSRGGDISIVSDAVTGPIGEINRGHKLPFIIAAPQCNVKMWFEISETVLGFIDMVAARPDVDRTRVYLSRDEHGRIRLLVFRDVPRRPVRGDTAGLRRRSAGVRVLSQGAAGMGAPRRARQCRRRERIARDGQTAAPSRLGGAADYISRPRARLVGSGVRRPRGIHVAAHTPARLNAAVIAYKRDSARPAVLRSDVMSHIHSQFANLVRRCSGLTITPAYMRGRRRHPLQSPIDSIRT